MTVLPLPQLFEANHAERDGRHVLVLSGELDIVSAAELEAMLRQVSTDETIGITLDLSKLTFIDSAGLRAVLLAKELTDSNGYEFSLVPGPPSIQRIFELTALLDVLPFQADAEHRIAADEPRTATEQGS